MYRGKEKANVIFSAFNLAFCLEVISKPWSRVVESKERPLIAFIQRNMMKARKETGMKAWKSNYNLQNKVIRKQRAPKIYIEVSLRFLFKH